MANPPGSFIWYELMTPDQDASKAFYDTVMAWTIEPEPSGDTEYRMLNAASGPVGGALKLTDEMAAGGARPGWVGYFYTEDVDATITQVTALGGHVLMPAHDFPHVGRFAMVTDPHGAPFYLMRPIPPVNNPDAASDAFVASPGIPGHVAWNELVSKDHPAALGFYGALFGFGSTESMSMGPMGDYAFIDHAGTRIGGAMTMADVPSHWLFYWCVPSVTTAIAAIKAGGGTLLNGPQEVPGGVHVAVATDPQGATFGIVGALD